MNFQAGMLLLLVTTLLSFITPTEYSSPPGVEIKCKTEIEECNELKTPQHEIGSYNCILRKKDCQYHCELNCPQHLTVPNNNSRKEIYKCKSGKWKKKDTYEANCVAKRTVKDVEQNLYSISDVNKLIRDLLETSYIYLAMASFYERADVALLGFNSMMTELWRSEVKHARDLMSYLNKRGGYIELMDIPRPLKQEKLYVSNKPGLEGLKLILSEYQKIITKAIKLRETATSKKSKDPHLKYILEDGIISHKTEMIKKLVDLIQKLSSFADEDYKIGEYLVDLEVGTGKNLVKT